MFYPCPISNGTKMVDLARQSTKPIEKIQMQKSIPILFYLSLLLFFISMASYGGLLLLNRAQARAGQTLRQEIQRKEEDLRPELIDQIFLLEERLGNIHTLLEKHSFPTQLLTLVEEITLPLVRFSSFNYQPALSRLDMSGETISYGLLAEQLGIWERNPELERVEFGGLSRTTGDFIGFKLNLTLKQSAFKKPPQLE